MKRLVTTTLACLLVTSAYAKDVDKNTNASPNGHVDVSNISGSVTVNGWNRNSVEVTGTLGRNVEDLILDRDGNKVVVKVKVPKRGGRGIDSDLQIMVPKNSSLDVGTVSADIEVAEVAGEQSLHTVSGDVETQYSGADVSAESVSGDVDINGDNADGEVDASTVSGDITLSRVAGEVKIEAVSGDLTIDEGSFRRAQLETVTGEIVFHAELRNDSKLDIDTVNGDVDVEFGGDVWGKYDVDTFNGRIRNCFGPKPQRTSKYAPGLELEFTHGDGDSRVKISTLNGDISICN